MWHAWIQNKELHVVLMYTFAITPPMAQKNVAFLQKYQGVLKYLLHAFQIDAESFN